MGFWEGHLHTICALHAACQVGQTHSFDKLYRGEHDEGIQVVQGAEANVRYVNDAISKSINALLGDQELMQCLESAPLQAH